jgi:hydroxyacylglutathione hydrolase
VFTGDTLFAGSVGRTDFPGGSHELLIEGVRQKIFALGDELRITRGTALRAPSARSATPIRFSA